MLTPNTIAKLNLINTESLNIVNSSNNKQNAQKNSTRLAIRDKQKTKQKLLGAVGKILKTKGYSGLMVSKIAAVAGYDKKLIYEYFGSTDKLIDEYIRSQDYWSNFNGELDTDMSDGGRQLSKNAIINQLKTLRKIRNFKKSYFGSFQKVDLCLKK